MSNARTALEFNLGCFSLRMLLPQMSRCTSVISDGSLKFLTTSCPATDIMDIIFVPSFVMPKVLPDITFNFSPCLLGSCLSSSFLFSPECQLFPEALSSLVPTLPTAELLSWLAPAERSVMRSVPLSHNSP